MNGYRTSYVTPAIRVVDAPISKKSPEQWKAIVEYKALAFTHDSNYASIAYDLKAARAVFDPNLAGGNGGFRCPVGTRYGGQITDRYGRGCGFGIARRLVNAIGDAARSVERGLDKRRERRVRRRNARVGRQIGVRGYTVPGRGGRGMATRLEDFADRRDRRQRRGRGGVPSGPGVATRLENFADRRDRRGDRGAATRLEDFADRRDQRQGRGRRGMATRLDDFADRRDRRQGRGGRGMATRLEDFADRRDRNDGIDVPERAPRTPKRPAKRPAAPNRRPRRSTAVAETAANRPRPKRPSTPVAEIKPPQRRQRGPRVDVGEPGSDRRKSADYMLAMELNTINDYWPGRLRNKPLTEENIRAYVAEREQREGASPSYINTLRAREQDWLILTGRNPHTKVNDLSPQVRKRINEGISRGEGLDRIPNAPRRPVKKRAVKKAAPKRPAKKVPAKKVPAKKAAAKKAAATRPERSVPDFADLDRDDRRFVMDALEGQGLAKSPLQVADEIDRQAAVFTPDGLDDFARNLENGARDDRRKARSAARPPRERVAYEEIAKAKEFRAKKLRQRAEIERVRAGNEPSAPDTPGAPGNPPTTPSRQPQARKPAAKLAKRVTLKNEAKLGRLDKNGYGKPQRVEVGNKGITDQAKAAKYLKDGGDLADVPDDFLGKAIQSNAGTVGAARFQLAPNAGGINGMDRYTDTKTGKQIGLKYMKDGRRGPGAYGVNEDVNEMVGAHIAERFGFANGAMRFAGPTRHSGNEAITPIAVELVDNYIGRKKTPTGNENWTVADLVRGQLLDAVILNTDRHGGNYFAIRDGDRHHFVPIDHGLGFNGRPGTRYSGQANADGFREWLRSGHGGRRVQGKSFHPILKERLRDDPAVAAEVRDEILAMQRDLKKAHRQQKGKQAVDDILAAVPNRNPVTSGGKSHYDAIKRLEWLMNANPNEVLDLLRGS